jgi:hypothetical protein
VPWQLDAARVEWVNEALGDRLSLGGMADLVDRLIEATDEDEIAELLDILADEAGPERVSRWKLAFGLLLKHLYLVVALLAAAGRPTVADLEGTQELLERQYAYLDRFADGLIAGTVSVAEAGRRMHMYVNSARSSFWRVLDRQMREAGYREERWIAIGDANTCDACWEAHLMGWQPIGTFAEPGSGTVLRNPTTECAGLTSCRCRKSYRR